MDKQRTITKEVSCSGVGIHTGAMTTLTFKPAPPDSGVIFRRVDLPDQPSIKADIDHVVDLSRGTTIGIGDVRVHTVEHAMSAIAGLGIDNIVIELDNHELPNTDGSALLFLKPLLDAGTVEQDAARQYVEIQQPIHFRNGDITLQVEPVDEFRVSMTIEFDHVAIGRQTASFVVTPEVYASEIASARTFCFLREVKMLQDQGLIKGGSLESAVVIGDEMVLNESLRFPDEPVRHKILDLVGDLFLLGRRIKGHVTAVKSGHEKNVLFTKKIRETIENGVHSDRPKAAENKDAKESRVLDVTRIMKIIPHRYPFLLVDRILDYEPQKSVRGIKNVSIGEPFFQGHWPEMPVMPGVLIIEAMAQVSSVLIFGEDGDPSRLPFFMGIDKAKFRRAVTPGDQLVIDSELVHLRSRACKVKAVARVDGNVVAQAEMMFGILPPEEKRDASAGGGAKANAE